MNLGKYRNLIFYITTIASFLSDVFFIIEGQTLEIKENIVLKQQRIYLGKFPGIF
jgi:hypothetical protein